MRPPGRLRRPPCSARARASPRLDISPSGRYAVYVAPAGGTASTAVVADLVSGGDARPIVRASGQPERLSWCRFVSDSRLICAIRGTGNLEGQLVGFTRIFSVNADGSNIREMGQQASLDDAGSGNSLATCSIGCRRTAMRC